MKIFQNDSLSGISNKIGKKTYLEFIVHLLETDYFNPIVFCHDNYRFDRKRYAEVMIGFINLMSFLSSCGIMVETEVEELTDVETYIYRNIMGEKDSTDMIQCYRLLEIDFTNFNMSNAKVLENCKDDDFSLVKIYLQLRAGTAMNKRAIENLSKRRYTDSEMITLRKQIENISGKTLVKRKDNAYEMR